MSIVLSKFSVYMSISRQSTREKCEDKGISWTLFGRSGVTEKMLIMSSIVWVGMNGEL